MRYQRQIISVIVIFFLCLFLTVYQNPFIFKVGTIRMGMKRTQVIELMGLPDETTSNEFEIDPLTMEQPLHTVKKDTYYLKYLWFRLSGERYIYQDEKLISHERVVLTNSMIQSQILAQPTHAPNN